MEAEDGVGAEDGVAAEDGAIQQFQKGEKCKDI